MNILDRIIKNIDEKQRPLRSDINLLFESENQCSRKKYPNYCPKIFDDTTCKGSGKPKYMVISSIPGVYGRSIGIGTHVFCEDCLQKYNKKIKEKQLPRHTFIWEK